MRPRQRLGLLLFGGALALLFVLVAIAEGIGRPTVPADAVAVVEDAPGGTAAISIADYRRELRRAGVEAGLQGAPTPADERYGELRDLILTSLISTVWTEGQAQEMGVSVHPVEVDEALREYRGRFLRSEEAYRKYLAQTGQRPADLENSIRVSLLQSEIGRELSSNVPKASDREIEAYYEEAKSTQFTERPARDVRLVVIERKDEAEQAKAALDADDSPQSWNRVVERYGADPASARRGGLSEGLVEGTLGETLDEAFFSAPLNQVEGPLRTPGGYYVFEAVGSRPGGVEPLDEEAERQIRSQLAKQALDEALAKAQYDFESLWRARTICAAGYMVEVCGNFDGPPRPPGAVSECYEADPREVPPACPAPVQQLQPALPGTVSLLEPKGEQLAQRPHPVPKSPSD